MEENKYALSLPQRLILVNQYKILQKLSVSIQPLFGRFEI